MLPFRTILLHVTFVPVVHQPVGSDEEEVCHSWHHKQVCHTIYTVFDTLDNEVIPQDNLPVYPLTSKLPTFKKFRKSLSEFIECLIASSTELGSLYSTDLILTIRTWVIAFDLSFLSSSLPSISLFLQPFTNDFPQADIHELLSPDLLHQVIKGTFKDHLVTWVESYLISTHGQAHAKEITDDIDKQ